MDIASNFIAATLTFFSISPYTSAEFRPTRLDEEGKMRKDKGRWKGVTCTAKDSKSDINRAFNTILEVEHLDQDYTILFPKESNTTDQGLLSVGGLEPRAGSLPRFLFRWDQKGNHLNVDIVGVSDIEKNSFEQGKNGYSGHRFYKVDQGGRLFHINILTPNKHVFKGRLSFSLGFTYEAIFRIGVKVHGNATVSR